MNTKYYPDAVGPLADPILFDAHKQTLDLLHDARAQIETMNQQITDLKKSVPGSLPQGATTTQIGGIFLKASVPTDGQKLTYVAADNQVEWK
jgi:hypothetical protein